MSIEMLLFGMRGGHALQLNQIAVRSIQGFECRRGAEARRIPLVLRTHAHSADMYKKTEFVIHV